ncbi:MAG: hypothetical protein A2097_12785 [Desulfobacula sp. GWF2_41_7]|nr:MAG: hypothetical protein A2097_12785 [Desulfobacula sp. GWF2_41_7]
MGRLSTEQTIYSTAGKDPITTLSTHIVFFVVLSIFLGTAGYLGVQLLREENQRKIHQLNMQLLSEQIGHILKERLRVVKALADDHLAADVVSGREDSNSERIRLFLHTAKEVSHSDVIYIIDQGGIAVSSTDIGDVSIIGYNYSFRPYFQNAVTGHTAIFPAFGVASRIRGLHLSTPIYGPDQHVPMGVMALKINISEVEDLLKIRKEKIAFVSPDNVIFSSNQADWLFHSIKTLTSQTRERLKQTRQFGEQEIKPLELKLDQETLSIDGETYYNTRTPLPISGWDIISLQKKDNQIPLPSFHKQILGVSLGVTGCLATLVFFLLIAMQHQKKARNMLRYAEENYAGIFRNAAMGIFRSTLDGRFIDANPSLASILGFSSPRHLMTSVTNIGDEVYVSADDRKELSRLLEENAEVQGFETRFHRRDGSVIWVTLTCRIAVDQANGQTYLEGFCMDISEKKSAEKTLQRERDIFSRVMVTSPVGIVMVNTNREITFANPRAEEILTLVRTGNEIPIYETPKWRITSIDGTKTQNKRVAIKKILVSNCPTELIFLTANGTLRTHESSNFLIFANFMLSLFFMFLSSVSGFGLAIATRLQ